MKAKRKKIILWTLAITGVLIIIGFLAIDIMLSRLNLYFDKIQQNMSIVEVRQLLKDSFHESKANVEQMEKEGTLWGILFPRNWIYKQRNILTAFVDCCISMLSMTMTTG